MLKNSNNYLGNPNVRGDDQEIGWTEETLLEYKKCLSDPVYFAESYCKVIHVDEGLVPFKLYDYQREMFELFNNNRFVVVLACRQSGKSISTVAYLLWYIIFKSEQVVGILANKGDTAREMLSRITLMLENLPFFLQPGCKALNKGSIEFCNNSKIVARATSSSSIRGMSMNLVYLDEFAFIERDEEFYTSTYPVISSGKSTKIIITSTRNGVSNRFNKIYEGAVQGTNEFKPFRVDWWDVPGRDEAWKKSTIANTSLMQFKQEFGNEIIGAGDTLITPEVLIGLIAIDPVAINHGGNLKIYTEPREGHNYIMTVDVAQGRGQDYSTFTIIDVTIKPFTQVCVYRDNMMSPLLFPDVIYKYASHYNDAYTVVENNDAGQIVCNGLYYELEYENVYVESMIKSAGVGVRMTTKTKRIGCSNIKDIIEQGELNLVDAQTIMECSSFVAKGKSYQAENNSHDDLMMNLVMFGWFTSTGFFQESTDINMKNLLYKEKIRQIEDDMIPAGIFHNDSLDESPMGAGWEIWKG